MIPVTIKDIVAECREAGHFHNDSGLKEIAETIEQIGIVEIEQIRKRYSHAVICLSELLDVVNAAIANGDWKVDGRCDPDMAIRVAGAIVSNANGDAA